jgi:uncharacterized protein YndB with AHSA1/START domain
MRILKGLLVLFIVLLIAVCVVYLVGARLPVDHTASATVDLPAPPEKVWKLLVDVKSQPSWRTGLKSVEPWQDPSSTQECWVEVQSGVKMPLCVEVTEPLKTRVVRIADKNLPFGGTWTYELEAVGQDQSKLTITERGTTGPAIWRFVGHYVMGDDSSIKTYESDLLKAVRGQP